MQNDRDQQTNRLRRQQDELHADQLRETELKIKVKEQHNIEQKLVDMRKELSETTDKLKVC